MRSVLQWCVTAVLMVLLSCGGGGGGNDDPPAVQCTIAEQNASVYEVMKEHYLWYDSLPQIDPTVYSSPDRTLDALRHSLDKWSYIESAEDFYQYHEEGKFPGMGFSARFDDSNRLWVAYVYEDSPANRVGMQRTDEIITINGRSARIFGSLDTLWDEIYRYDTASIELRRPDGGYETVSLQWAWVTINTVLHHEVIQHSGRNVGYLVFKSFLDPSVAELNTVFASFQQQGVEELILDLRYNGGGSLLVAQHLASLIAGGQASGGVFSTLVHSNLDAQYDKAYNFENPPQALDLSRLFVIATGSTCSASESIINGLRPYMDVVVVGDTTCGKPVGMHAFEFCDLVMLPIGFRVTNADGDGDYFDGLPATCTAPDDMALDFGDPEESSFMTALYYIENGGCPIQTTTLNVQPSDELREKNRFSGLREEIGAF